MGRPTNRHGRGGIGGLHRRRRFLGAVMLAAALWSAAAVNAGAAPLLAKTIDEVKTWAEKFVQTIAKGDAAAAKALYQQAFGSGDAGPIDGILTYMSGKGSLQLIDLVEEKKWGGSVLILTHFIRLDEAEAFLHLRFHRTERGWEIRVLKFENDYDKIPWN